MRIYKDSSTIDFDWIIHEIGLEHLRQVRKWGLQERTAFEWMTYILEELGELAEAVSEHEYRGAKKRNIVDEAFQVATLAVKIAALYRGKNEKK